MDNLINKYYNKSFISSLLCKLNCGFSSFLYQLITFPTILSSSILTVLNSSNHFRSMKIKSNSLNHCIETDRN